MCYTGIFLSILYGCSYNTEIQKPQDCDCPPAELTSFGYHLPKLFYSQPHLSPDGSTLAFIVNEGDTKISFLNMKTLQLSYIYLASIIPNYPADELLCTELYWSPYSSDRLYIHTVSFFDTLGNSRYAQNGYILTISTQKAWKITPSKVGPFGSEGYLGFYSWLKGSNPQIDSFIFDDSIYVPQQDKCYPLPESYKEIIHQAPNSSNYFIYRRDSIKDNPPQLFINGERSYVAQHMIGEITPHWSLSGNKMAFTVKSDFPSDDPIDPHSFYEVWIYDISQNYVYRLNLRSLFCMYDFVGSQAEFLTDSTLAISMHKDGDDFAPLWEISTTGKLIRQLTFKP